MTQTDISPEAVERHITKMLIHHPADADLLSDNDDLLRAQSQRIVELEREIGWLRGAYRVQAIKADPSIDHDKITDFLNRFKAPKEPPP